MARSTRRQFACQDHWGVVARTSVGTFETATAAVRPIRDLEGYPNTGVFLELHFDTELGTDLAAFSVLHHTGRKALYGLRRRGRRRLDVRDPDRMTAKDEVRSVLYWARRTGYANIAAALDCALANGPRLPGRGGSHVRDSCTGGLDNAITPDGI